MATFEEIYTAAKTKNIAKLAEFVQAKVFIDATKENRLYYETAAYQHALEGDDAAVELLHQRGAGKNYVAQGYAHAGNHAKVEEYRVLHKASGDYIASCYAQTGNHAKVEEYRVQHKAHVNDIAIGYAIAGKHAKVEEYRVQHMADVNVIAYGYAHAGNHAKVEEYRVQHNASINDIVSGYALASNHAKVEEYRVQHEANINVIAQGYARVGNHAKVEEYRVQHKAHVNAIANGYALAGNNTKAQEYRNLAAEADKAKMAAVTATLAPAVTPQIMSPIIVQSVSSTPVPSAYVNMVLQLKTLTERVKKLEQDKQTQQQLVTFLSEKNKAFEEENAALKAELARRPSQSTLSSSVLALHSPIATTLSTPPGPAATLSSAKDLVSAGLYQSCSSAGATSAAKRSRYQNKAPQSIKLEEDDVTQVEKASRNNEYAAPRGGRGLCRENGN